MTDDPTEPAPELAVSGKGIRATVRADLTTGGSVPEPDNSPEAIAANKGAFLGSTYVENIRQKYASMAMQGLLASKADYSHSRFLNTTAIAEDAVAMADALLRELAK